MNSTFFCAFRVSKKTSKNFRFFSFFLLTFHPAYAILYFVDGALAQLVAHNTGSVGVSGSNPLCSTHRVRKNSVFSFSITFVGAEGTGNPMLARKKRMIPEGIILMLFPLGLFGVQPLGNQIRCSRVQTPNII